jgi:ribosomal protein S17
MLEDSTQTAASRKVRQGRVVSDATDKTVVVRQACDEAEEVPRAR